MSQRKGRPITYFDKNCNASKAYNALKSISERCSKWYYLNSLSAMNLGYYDLKTFEAIEKRLDYYAKFVYSSFY